MIRRSLCRSHGVYCCYSSSGTRENSLVLDFELTIWCVLKTEWVKKGYRCNVLHLKWKHLINRNTNDTPHYFYIGI